MARHGEQWILAWFWLKMGSFELIASQGYDSLSSSNWCSCFGVGGWSPEGVSTATRE
jgi:hypothetical protein